MKPFVGLLIRQGIRATGFFSIVLESFRAQKACGMGMSRCERYGSQVRAHDVSLHL